METDNNQLLIFKTDISGICSNCTVYKMLDNNPEIQSWSIDNDDTDNVLRIISATLTPDTIINMIAQLGHECREL